MSAGGVTRCVESIRRDTYHPGLTIVDRTWDRRVELLVFGRLHVSVGQLASAVTPKRYTTHLVNTLQVWAQSTMHAEHLPIDDRAKSQIIEHLAAPSPYIATPVFALAFVVKAIDLCDLARLVVSADKRHAFWISYFKSKQQEEGLDAVESAVNKVTWGYVG